MIALGQLFGPLVVEMPDSLSQQWVQCSQLITDSRKAGPGSVFFAIRGSKIDGHSYVSALIDQGVAACVVETDFKCASREQGARLIRVRDTREALGWAMAHAHGNPSHAMKIVGVTGTSGKTTTTYLVEHMLRAAGHKVGVIGTVNFRVGDDVLPSTHTTPGSPELQELLSTMKAKGCTAVVMEVSSHALKQHRTAGIAFDVVVFTNLSREHLDFHLDMEDYFQSKRLLFSVYPLQAKTAGKTCTAVVNSDDEYGRRLLSELRPLLGTDSVRSYSMDHTSADLCGLNLKLGMDGITGQMQSKQGDAILVRANLFARFNAYNLIAAAEACRVLGVSSPQISSAIATFGSVPGRLERVSNDLGIVVLVDYAHKPDALEKVLKTLGELRQPGQKIVTVVGCGGDRDRTKRPVMGRLAAELSDWAVITSDNPRTEDPAAIIQEIVSGIPEKLSSRSRIEQDRARAIDLAIGLARRGDLVLIAGKGHEDYQILGTTQIHFDDREVAAAACARRKDGSGRLKS
jgi:UDP-N-acetylmuramoyl-L-alanyl-D-glutamate--2,6-diaminopimelate ligase